MATSTVSKTYSSAGSRGLQFLLIAFHDQSASRFTSLQAHSANRFDPLHAFSTNHVAFSFETPTNHSIWSLIHSIPFQVSSVSRLVLFEYHSINHKLLSYTYSSTHIMVTKTHSANAFSSFQIIPTLSINPFQIPPIQSNIFIQILLAKFNNHFIAFQMFLTVVPTPSEQIFQILTIFVNKKLQVFFIIVATRVISPGSFRLNTWYSEHVMFPGYSGSSLHLRI